MTKIEDLQEKVTKAQVTVEKKQATIIKHEKQLDKKIVALEKKGINLRGLNKDEIEKVQEGYRKTDESWEIYDVKRKMEDIKGATKKLTEAERILAGHQERLNLAVEKERFLEGNAPQVIKDFLENWKAMTYEWYVRKYDAYKEFEIKIKSEVKEAEAELGDIHWRDKEKILKEKKLDYRSVQSKIANFAGAIVLKMATMYNKEERLEWLEKTIEADKQFKMLDLINRINAVVGTITDASNLSISLAGNLNGFIIGENGKAKVETIGAGGYNIQVFHYRTLVHEVK